MSFELDIISDESDTRPNNDRAHDEAAESQYYMFQRDFDDLIVMCRG